MTERQRILLALTLAEGIGPATIHGLLKAYPTEHLGELLSESAAAIVHRAGISTRRAEVIVAALKALYTADREYEQSLRAGITLVSLDEHEYPHLLRTCAYPPVVLWFRVKLPSIQSMVGIVGSREATPYGLSITDQLVSGLAGSSVAVVSGGARGIDTRAHEASMRNGVGTLAVLGSGLLCPYPTENIPLFRAIGQSGGAVISPFPAHTRPVAGNFPARNHLIAAFSSVLIVVEAAEKSGALITARAALDMGRDVAAVPGRIGDIMSAGCNRLIAEGAHVIRDPGAITQLMGIAPKTYRELPKSAEKIPSEHSQKDPLVVLCALPQPFDSLLAATGLSPDILSQKLTHQACLGTLTQDLFGRWTAIS